MFLPNDTIHFSCHQCGKCCQSSPNMHLYDMLELSSEFIFQTAHHAVLAYTKAPLDKELSEHYKILGHTIVLPELDAVLFYFIDFTTIAYPSYKACPKLIDNKCSIYGRHPSTCKLAPFNAKFDDAQQWRTLNYYKKNTEDYGWKCSFDKTDPIVFKDQQINNPSQNAMYFQSVDHIRDFTDHYINFLSLAGEDYKNNHFKAVFNSVNKNSLMITDMITSLQVARQQNIISGDLAIDFVKKQIALIDKEIEPSLFFKKKENVQTTRLYKKQKEDYIKALDSGLFEDKIENFDIIMND